MGIDHRHCVKKRAFIWCHHQREFNDPEAVLEVFLFKKEFKCSIYEGGAAKKYNLPQLKECLLKKFNMMFDAEIHNQPWCMTNFHEEYVENIYFYQFCKLLRQWCFSYPYSLLLINYSIEDHFQKFNYLKEELRKELGIDSAEEKENRVIVILT